MYQRTSTSKMDEEFTHLPTRPWAYVGFKEITFQACTGAPIVAGGTCDHCSTGIRDAFAFQSRETGESFVVGSTCVDKMAKVMAGKEATDRGIQKALRAIKDERNKKARIRNAAKRLEAQTLALELIETTRPIASTMPHPRGWDGQSLTDWAEWMVKNGGGSAKAEVVRVLKRIDMTDPAELAKAEEAKVDAARATETKVAEVFASNPGLADAMALDHKITNDIRGRFLVAGYITEPQIELVLKVAADEAEKANAPTPVNVPVTDKRIKITGTIVHAYTKETMYGTQYKMIVSVPAEGGAFKLCGSVPSALPGTLDEINGLEIEFMAKVEASDDDPTFGFFKRPTKIVVIGSAPVPHGDYSETPWGETNSAF